MMSSIVGSGLNTQADILSVSLQAQNAEFQLISGAQIRAARALLGVRSREFADIAGVSWATIKRFEEREGIPPSRSGTLERVKTALKQAGIEFIGDPVSSPGVRLRRP